MKIKIFKRIRERNSYFRKLIMCYLMVLLVPVATIILQNVASQAVVKKQVLLANQNMLKQFFYLVDAMSENMTEICLTLAYNYECTQYANETVWSSDKASYKVYEIKQFIASLPKKGCSDIFVYFPDENRIISGENSSLTLEDYYNTYYGKTENGFAEEFYEVANCQEESPSFQIMNKDSEKRYLCISMKSRREISRKNHFIVTVVLDPDYLNQILVSSKVDQSGNIIMFNKEGKLLINGNGDDVEYNLEKYNDNGETYEVTFDKNTYIMQVEMSKVLKGYYACATPTEYFMGQLAEVRLISFLGIGACLILGILVVVEVSRKGYRPVEEILNTLQEKYKVEYDAEQSTEFAFIESLFKEEDEEKNRLYQKINVTEGEKKEQQLERFLISLIEGKVNCESAGDDVYEKNGILLCSDRFFLGILKVHELEEEEWEISSFTIKNVFNELCNRKHKGYVVPVSNNEYIIVMNLKQLNDKEELVDLLKEGKEFLEHYYKIKGTIGTSDIHEGAMGLSEAYKEARLSLRYEFLLGKGKIIAHWDVMGKEFHSFSYMESQFSKKMEGFIKFGGKIKSPNLFVEELFDLYGIHEGISLETMECFKFDVINSINTLMISSGYALIKRHAIIEKLLSQETLDTFREFLAEFVSGMYCREQEDIQQGDVCSRTKEFIDQNYMDARLSISSLGEEIGISSSYLSKLFKEKYEISILDYIACVRIASAKKMLQQTELSLNDIAEWNGFLSSNVFIKTFKKNEGITPGRFRDLLF